MLSSTFPALGPMRNTLLSATAVISVLLIGLPYALLSNKNASTAASLQIWMVFIILLWLLQWLCLSGEATPQLRFPTYVVWLMALPFGLLDAAFAYCWTVTWIQIVALLGINDPADGNLAAYTALVGLPLGIAWVVMTGLVMARFDWMRMLLWSHVAGGFGLVVLSYLFAELGRASDYPTETDLYWRDFVVMGDFGLGAIFFLLFWGIAPISYLVTYRGYRKRLKDRIPSE
jgi:hypothetical protein